MKLSLKNKLIFSIVIILVIAGIIASYLAYFYSRNVFIENEKDNLSLLTVSQAGKVSETMVNIKLLGGTLAGSPLLVEYLSGIGDISAEEVIAQLQLFDIGGYFGSIYLMDRTGMTILSTNPSFTGNNYGFRDYFKKAIYGVSYIDVSVGVTSGELGYYFSFPVKSGNTIIGVLVMKGSPLLVENAIALESEFLKSIEDVLIVDEYGVIIHSNKKDRIYKSLGKLDDISIREIEEKNRFPGIKIDSLDYQLLQDKFNSTPVAQVFELFDEMDNKNEIISTAQIAETNFYFIIEEDADRYERQAINFSIFIILIIVSIMITMVVVVFVLSFIFISPLNRLRKFTKEVGRGKFDKQIEINTGDEIEDLADDFNKMILAIKESRADVDKKVKIQTADVLQKGKDMENQQKAILNILEDVAFEKKKTEEVADDLKKFQLAVANASDHIVITDSDGIILYANEAVEKITGFTVKEILGKKAGGKDTWGGQMDLDFYKKMWKTIKNDKKSFSGELKNKKKDGIEYEVRASIAPILNKDGEVVYFVGIERDITKEKEVDRIKSEFVSVASHQLRTPLTAIRWFLEELYNEELGKINKEQKDYINQALESNDRMVRLVNDLLNVSRLETGRVTIKPEPTNMIDLINSIINESKPITQALNCSIVFKKPKQKIDDIKIDKSLIGEVVKNLISNAIKYSSNKKCSVLVSLSKKGSDLIFSVKDNGVGIPENLQHRIFEKFFRADNVVKMETEGTGLGLYISKMVVEASGGKIWFESSPKETIFSFSLPLSGSPEHKGERSLA